MRTLRTSGLCVVALSLALHCGCEPGLPGEGQSVTNLRPENLPDWADKQGWLLDGRRYFTGRGTADHPLDEKNALAEALDDAIQTIAKTAGAEAKVQTRWTQHEAGDPGLGDRDREHDRNVTGELIVEGLVVGVQQEKVYWDRIKDSVTSYQYRYLVLVSVADQDFQNLINEIKKKKS